MSATRRTTPRPYELQQRNTVCGAGNRTPCFFPDGSRLTSAVGWGLTYSTIDSRLDPHEGVYFRFAQDFAGVGGDARFIRTTAMRASTQPLIEDNSDLVGMVKVTGGNITGLGQPVATVDNFFKGGETIRGFASLGYGPREYDVRICALGGKNYVNGTAEVQFPLPGIPPDWGLQGRRPLPMPACCGVSTCRQLRWRAADVIDDDTAIRSSVGGSIIWQSPFGPIRADFARR